MFISAGAALPLSWIKSGSTSVVCTKCTKCTKMFADARIENGRWDMYASLYDMRAFTCFSCKADHRVIFNGLLRTSYIKISLHRLTPYTG